jgi:O-methyltransferase
LHFPRTISQRLRTILAERRLSPVARRVLRERLTYLGVNKLAELEHCKRFVSRYRVPGQFVETGVALGGSAIVLAHGMPPDRRFRGYDLFAQIPPPSERDDARAHERYAEIAAGGSQGIGGDAYYGYLPDLYERVVATFARHGLPVDGHRIALRRGLFEETLHPDGPIALVHIDSDWYDSVSLCLARVVPHLSRGGLIVLDDFFDYGGCADATREFLAAHTAFRVHRQAANLVLVRN